MFFRLPLTRELSAKQTEGEKLVNNKTISPSVKIKDFATSLVRGRQAYYHVKCNSKKIKTT